MKLRLRASSITVAVVAVVAVSLLLVTSAFAYSAVAVSPRDNCGGSNGTVAWQSGTNPWVEYSGTVWNNCPGYTSVWLSWDSPTHHNVDVGRAARGQHVPVFYHTGTFLNPGHIAVKVCSTYPTWHCGAPIHV